MYQERLEGKGATRVVGYGHVGDGNMHLNITTPEYSQEVMDGIEPFLYEWTSGHRWRFIHLQIMQKLSPFLSLKYFPNRGSISAEHGLGFKKRNFIHFSKSDSAVFLMKQIKQVKKMKMNTSTFYSTYWYFEIECPLMNYKIQNNILDYFQDPLNFVLTEQWFVTAKAWFAGVRSEGHHEPLQSSPGWVNQWIMSMHWIQNKLIQPNLDQANWYQQ